LLILVIFSVLSMAFCQTGSAICSCSGFSTVSVEKELLTAACCDPDTLRHYLSD
jgi:hypothetical protein